MMPYADFLKFSLFSSNCACFFFSWLKMLMIFMPWRFSLKKELRAEVFFLSVLYLLATTPTKKKETTPTMTAKTRRMSESFHLKVIMMMKTVRMVSMLVTK